VVGWLPRRTAVERGSIERLVAACQDEPGLLALYLFGSRARGDASASSDIDLGALFDGPLPLDRLVQLEARLADAGGRRVDLVDLRTAGAFLALDVIRGDRLYCAEPYRCDEFELYVMRRAGDLEPFERKRRAALLRPGSLDAGPRGET
jgi:predicted nucleotidyltransferase